MSWPSSPRRNSFWGNTLDHLPVSWDGLGAVGCCWEPLSSGTGEGSGAGGRAGRGEARLCRAALTLRAGKARQISSRFSEAGCAPMRGETASAGRGGRCSERDPAEFAVAVLRLGRLRAVEIPVLCVKH